MIYLLYKTTNTINQKFYIGVHKQVTLDFDGYLGSGTSIKKAIRKYGKHNFTREILEVFPEPDSAFKREYEVVSLIYKLPECYNEHPGGRGIRTYNASTMKRKPMSQEERHRQSERMKQNNPSHRSDVREKISNSKKGVKIKSRNRSQSVTLDGVNYSSKSEACRQLGISFTALEYRLKRSTDQIRKRSQGNPVKVQINNVVYNSFTQAKLILYPNVSIPTARKLMRQLGMIRIPNN